MLKLSRLVDSYCKALSVESSSLLGDKRTEDVIKHRMKFSAIVMKKHFPCLLEGYKEKNSGELLKVLSENIGGSKARLSILAKNTRFYYCMHSRFRSEVDQLVKEIEYAA